MGRRSLSFGVLIVILFIGGLFSCSEDPVELNGPNPQPPATPVLISPDSGSVFNHYPRAVTFVWSEVSGTNVTYGIEVQAWIPVFPGPGGSWNAWRADSLLADPTYYMDQFIGAQGGRWRAWATNDVGNSPKTGWWTFEFTVAGLGDE